jgi:hypothetical protein
MKGGIQIASDSAVVTTCYRHGEYLAMAVFAAELGLPFLSQILLRCQVRLGITGHITESLPVDTESGWQLGLLSIGKLNRQVSGGTIPGDFVSGADTFDGSNLASGCVGRISGK